MNVSWDEVYEDVDLPAARMAAHRTFDQIWKQGHLTRSTAYRWLQSKMNLTSAECHMAEMTIEQCNEVVEVSNEYLEARGGG